MKIKVWDEFIRKLPIEAKVVECFQKCFFPCFSLSANLGRTSDIFVKNALGCMKRYHLVSERWKSPAVFRCMPVKYYEHNAGRFISPDLKFLHEDYFVFKFDPQVKKSWGMFFICFLQKQNQVVVSNIFYSQPYLGK